MPVNLEIHEGVATVTMNAPDTLNALTVDELHDLRDVLAQCRDNDAVRVIVLTGAGQRSFSTGTNLRASMPPDLPAVAGDVAAMSRSGELGAYPRLMDLHDLEIWKPMIAAVNGYCMGGGLELAMQCDIRVASETASFALPEVKTASVPAVGGIQAVIRAIGTSHAMHLALTGDRIDAARALTLGLVSQVTPADDLLAEAQGLAARIAGNGPLAVRLVKKLVADTSHLSSRDFTRQSASAWSQLRDTADRIEGRRAFAEKRKPEFKGE